MKRFFAWACCILLCLSFAAGCASSKTEAPLTSEQQENRDRILQSGPSDATRNELLREDLTYYLNEFPKKHKNPFGILSREEFEARMNDLIARVDTLDNVHVFIELQKIVAAVGDAHTGLNFYDGFHYPLEFYLFQGGVYIVNADKSLESLLYARVTAIDGTPVDEVLKRLSALAPHENESWLSSCLAGYLRAPIYLYGADVVKEEAQAVFTTEKDGITADTTLRALAYEESADPCVKLTSDVFTGVYDELYSYEYLPESKALYFAYNECTDWAEHRFRDFNRELFEAAAANDVERIVLDLRCNSGGNSEVLNPFTSELKSYLKQHADIKVFILVSRNTFSSGIFAIYRTIEAAPGAVSVGECSGGSPDAYGEVKVGYLPNSRIIFSYSTKYFAFSEDFAYKNAGDHTFLPDVELEPSIDDYIAKNDVVLNYALSH